MKRFFLSKVNSTVAVVNLTPLVGVVGPDLAPPVGVVNLTSPVGVVNLASPVGVVNPKNLRKREIVDKPCMYDRHTAALGEQSRGVIEVDHLRH